MNVRVLFFGVLRDLVGKASETLDLRDGACAGDVLTHYESQVPQMKESLASVAIAVNQEYSSPGTKLNSDDEIALLPPVSGGLEPATGEPPHRCLLTNARLVRVSRPDAKKDADDAA
jgi:molybdopterin converting factor subunit 1